MGAEFFAQGANAATAAGGKGPGAGPGRRMRTAHRWIATFFLLTVAANFAARIFGEPAPWITYAPLPPLLLLMGTGLVMLVVPGAGAWRGRWLWRKGGANDGACR